MKKKTFSVFLTLCLIFTGSLTAFAQKSDNHTSIFEDNLIYSEVLFPDAFRINATEVSDKLIFNYQRGLYNDFAFWGSYPRRFYDLLKVVPEEDQGNRIQLPSDLDYGKRLTDPDELVLFFKNGSKITYTFYERAIEVHGEKLDGTPLFSPGYQKTQPDVYAHFLDFIKIDRRDNEYNCPLWLGTMNPKKIASINLQHQNMNQGTMKLLPNEDNFDYLMSEFRRGMYVIPDSFRKIKKSEIKGEYIFKLIFKSNVTFTIRVEPTKLEIAASNMAYICSYDLREASYQELTRTMNAILNPIKK